MFDHKNVRVNVVHRVGDKDWEGTGRYLSIRAKKQNGKLFQGPDIPITSNLPDEEIERIVKLILIVVCGDDEDLSSSLTFLAAAMAKTV